MTGEGDQRWGEWESIKIPQGNMACIPNQTRHTSFLTRPKSHSYRKAIGHQNQVRNCSGNTNWYWQEHVWVWWQKSNKKSVHILTDISLNTLWTCLKNNLLRAIETRKARAFWSDSSRLIPSVTSNNQHIRTRRKNQNLKTQAGLPGLALPWFEQQELKPTGKWPEHKESRQHKHTARDEAANAQNEKWQRDLVSPKRKHDEKILRRKNWTVADRRNEANNDGHLGHLPRRPSLWALAWDPPGWVLPSCKMRTGKERLHGALSRNRADARWNYVVREPNLEMNTGHMTPSENHEQ
jgi:hypothetical protein